MTTLDELRQLDWNTLEADCARLEAEMKQIHIKAGERSLTAGEQTRWDNLEAGVTARRAVLQEVTDQFDAERAAKVAAVREARVLARDSFSDHRGNRGSFGPDEDRGRAVIDDAFRTNLLPAHAAEKATALIEQGHPGERSLAGRWAAAAGNPAYRTAFAKILADPTHGHLLWDAREQDAYRQVAVVQSELEARTAMSTTAGNGGYMIPLTLDPAILITNDGSNNPLRQLASVKQTMTNSWTGITSAGATSEWKVEGAEAADGSPTLGNPVIPTFLGDVFVPYSYEVGMDAMNFLEELAVVMADSLDNLHAVAFTTGNGTSAPQGIVTGLAGTASEINGQGSEAIASTDPFDLQNALPARFSANATWQANIATMNVYRQFETTGGSHEFPELRENPPTLLGKRFYENSNMDGAINAAATANNYVMIYGDIAKCYFIVDRVGARLETLPNLVGENGRPTGQRGAFLWARTGAEVVVPQAARLLDIPTTA